MDLLYQGASLHGTSRGFCGGKPRRGNSHLTYHSNVRLYKLASLQPLNDDPTEQNGDFDEATVAPETGGVEVWWGEEWD